MARFKSATNTNKPEPVPEQAKAAPEQLPEKDTDQPEPGQIPESKELAVRSDCPVLEARWGAEGSWADVTRQVQSLAPAGRFVFNNAHAGGDPCFGVRKSLVVRLLENGQESERILMEGEECDLSALFLADAEPHVATDAAEPEKGDEKPTEDTGANKAGDGFLALTSETLEELKRQNPDMFREFFELNCLNVQPRHAEGRAVLDLGANYGFFGLKCLTLGAKYVVAVEPDKDNFAVLNKNATGREMFPVPCAVMPYGVTWVRMIESGGEAKTLADENGPTWSRTLEELLTCWFLSDDNSMVLKIDIEGGEYDVLLDAPGRALRRFEYIFIDTHQTPHLEDRQGRTAAFLEEYLGVLGFDVEEKKNIYHWGWDDKGDINKYEQVPNQESWILRRR